MFDNITLGFNALFYFWTEIILIITSIIYGYIIYKNRYLKQDIELKNDMKKLTALILSLSIIITIHYVGLSRQGLNSIFTNPYLAAKASKLAPNPNQITNVEKLENLSDEEKLKTTIIVFKFGCPACQKLWIKAQEQKELLPSKNVLWLSNKKSNKEKSQLIRDINKYPTIIQWIKINDEIKQITITEPSDNQLKQIIENIKK